MIQTGLLAHAHKDLLTDTAYDFYGTRLATCAIDHRIKIWQLDETNGKWNEQDDWKAHDAPVSRVSWAHPEFGNVIASSSYDRTVKIWEQVLPSEEPAKVTANGATASANANSSRWVERAVMTDARGTVRAVEFAPRHFGFKIATIASDNFLRVYECLEQPSLKSWQLSDQVDVPSLAVPNPFSGVSASPLSRVPSAVLAAPTLPGDGAVAVPSSVSAGAGAGAGALPTSSASPAPQQPSARNQAVTTTGNREADGGWCLSWCKERHWGETIAVGAGTSGIIKVVQLSVSHKPVCLLALQDSPSPSGSTVRPGHSAAVGSLSATSGAATVVPERPAMDVTVTAGGGSSSVDAGTVVARTDSGGGSPPFSVTSVSWAPSCGRSYHLVATGGRDGHVRIWRVKSESEWGDDEERWMAGDDGRSSGEITGRAAAAAAVVGVVGDGEEEKKSDQDGYVVGYDRG